MSLVHLERPAAGEPEGTLVLLHGRGADEHDLLGLLDVLDPAARLRGITVGGPLRLPGSPGRHWYVVPRVGFPDHDTFHDTLGQLTALLDDELGLDWSRTVIGGFSQGTVMSYAVGLGAGRPVPAGILAMSGFIPTVDGWRADLAPRAGLPVLIVHGSQDPVISVSFAHEARRRLADGGADVSLVETPYPHAVDPRAVPAARAWLAERP